MPEVLLCIDQELPTEVSLKLDRTIRSSKKTFCTEVSGDGWYLFASTSSCVLLGSLRSKGGPVPFDSIRVFLFGVTQSKSNF